ncbi:hypothetical protein FB45DRAFT_69515 [Roridomyces roridus]|uniref:F-box domain-containing protein n=1 Tax=Roridomyces roridus TaxID=1738132 RepID=A0AAD7FLB7_9AGAR|nr:hypothetical protein FB45DRAFT_69515 [Roridomyces roridus]
MLDSTSPTRLPDEVLNSNNPALECHVPTINAFLLHARTKKSYLDDRIAQLESSLNDLYSERDALDCEIQRHAATLSPLRRTPPEIISHIFTLALTPDDDEKWYFQESAPWALSATCARWRSIALSPVFWTTISNGVDNFDISKLETLLSRSGSLPLRIRFWTDNEKDMNQGEIRMVDLLAKHCARWEHLLIGGAEELYARIQHVRNQLPMLRTLEFDLFFDIPPDTESALDIFSHAPKLEEVSSNMVFWRDPIPLALPWPQLSKYQTAIDWTALPSLASATNLVECTLDTARDAGVVPDHIQRVSFPRLIRLSVSSTALLACLDTPILMELYFHHCEKCNENDFDTTTFLNALPRTVQKLVLDIKDTTIAILDLTSIMGALPAIKYFGFMEDLSADVVCDFLRTSAPQAPAWERVALVVCEGVGPPGADVFSILLETLETMDWEGAARRLRTLTFHINSVLNSTPSPSIRNRLAVLQERGVDIEFDQTYSHFHGNSVPEFFCIDHD